MPANSTDGKSHPPGKAGKVNILLIGNAASDADLIKRELGMQTGTPYTAWYCSDLEEAMEFIQLRHINIEIIFMDLSMFNSDYPKERFLQVKQSIPDIPIIVLTDRTDYDLQHFVMVEGAADNISQWQIRSDPDRLRNVVESCRARHEIAKKEYQKSAKDLLDVHDQNYVNLQGIHDRHARNLQLIKDDNATAMRDVQDENLAAVRSANDKGDAILKYAQEKGALELKKATDQNKELRRENNHARDMLSGSYSTTRRDDD